MKKYDWIKKTSKEKIVAAHMRWIIVGLLDDEGFTGRLMVVYDGGSMVGIGGFWV